VWQASYDAYGTPISVVDHAPHERLHAGHKGLFVERLDAAVVQLPTFQDTPRLWPGATLAAHARNRTLLTHVGRWGQMDPNATGMALVQGQTSHGVSFLMDPSGFRLGGHFADGPNVFQYCRGTPYGGGDPMGLFFSVSMGAYDGDGRSDPFDMVDDFIVADIGSKMALLETVDQRLKTALQFIPLVGVGVATYEVATGTATVGTLLAIVPGGRGIGLLAKSLGWKSLVKQMYGGAAKYAMKTETHHLLPKQFRKEFDAAKLDIEEYTVRIPEELHKAIHGAGTGMKGSWNQRWFEFFRLHPKAEAQQIRDQLSIMMEEFGLIHAILKKK
jgi:hypothetical protein